MVYSYPLQYTLGLETSLESNVGGKADIGAFVDSKLLIPLPLD